MPTDARTIYRISSLDELRARQNAVLAGQGLNRTAGAGKVVAYVSHDRWVADCAHCGGGIGLWDENPEAVCLDCGRVWDITWPTPADRRKAESLLDARPFPQNRNWDPRRGETVADLARQNKDFEVT